MRATEVRITLKMNEGQRTYTILIWKSERIECERELTKVLKKDTPEKKQNFRWSKSFFLVVRNTLLLYFQSISQSISHLAGIMEAFISVR